MTDLVTSFIHFICTLCQIFFSSILVAIKAYSVKKFSLVHIKIQSQVENPLDVINFEKCFGIPLLSGFQVGVLSCRCNKQKAAVSADVPHRLSPRKYGLITKSNPRFCMSPGPRAPQLSRKNILLFCPVA